jgi:hypothetical protein
MDKMILTNREALTLRTISRKIRQGRYFNVEAFKPEVNELHNKKWINKYKLNNWPIMEG